MFLQLLRDVVDGTDGGLAGILMDAQGIPVETYVRAPGGVDMAVVGAEYSVIVKSIRRAAESLDAGGAREIAIQSDKMTTLIRMLNDDYFVAVALSPDANFGKGRYLMRTAAPKLLAALA